MPRIPPPPLEKLTPEHRNDGRSGLDDQVSGIDVHVDPRDVASLV